MDIGTVALFISCDVIFHGNIFPLNLFNPSPPSHFYKFSPLDHIYIPTSTPPFPDMTTHPTNTPTFPHPHDPDTSINTPLLLPVPLAHRSRHLHSPPLTHLAPPSSTPLCLIPSQPISSFLPTNLPDPTLNRSSRTHKPPTYLQDYDTTIPNSLLIGHW